LPPFHKDEIGTLYTSNDARAWTKLGYNYPELVNTTPEALAVLIRQKYGGGFDRFSTTSPVPGIESDRFRDYVINIRYDRCVLSGQFNSDFLS
jgi:tyrosinase